MNERFLIIDKLKKTIIYIDKILDNFPHKYIELKRNIDESLYDLIECAYFANSDIDRIINQKKCIVKLQLVDFYLMISFKKEIISKKKYESISKHLLEIKKMLYGWINSNEKEE